MQRSLLFILYTLLSISLAAQSGYGTGGGFNPGSPGVPGANGLYLEQGLLVLDGFKYDELSEAVYDVWVRYCHENGWTNDNDIYNNERREAVFGQVHHIIVCGELKSAYDDSDPSITWKLSDDFPNVTTLDLSRTYGWSADASLADWTTLQVLILPDCVELLPSLKQLEQLTDVFCYAEMPPVVDLTYYERDFFSPGASVTVHVPDGAVSFYQATEWSQAKEIVSLDQNVAKLEVKMPEGADLEQYRNMQLVLTDEAMQQSTRYVVTDRKSYLFPGLNADEGTAYSVALQNRLGTAISQRSHIEPKVGLNSVQLSSALPVSTYSARVLTPDGTDVTAQAQLAWLDQDGNRLTGSATLAGVANGDEPRLSVSLPAALARSYAQPKPVTATAPHTTVSLQPLKQHTVTATVRDATTRQPLQGITMSARQTLADDLTASFITTSDARGQCSLQVLEGPLTLSFSSQDYLRQDVERTTDFATDGVVAVGDVMLSIIQGKTVSLSLNTIEPVLEGEQASPLPLTDASDLLFSVFNVTKDKEMASPTVQYPLLVLPQGVDDGDELRLTISSASDAFEPLTATVTIAGNSAALSADIREHGGFRSTFRSTENSSVAALLYDSNSRQVRSYVHSSATLTVKGLKEGYYTLVTLANDPVLSSLLTLEDLSAAGLRQNLDYVKREFHVSPAVITKIEMDDIPRLDTEGLKVTVPSSTFSVGKSQVIQGSYLTVRSTVQLKSEYSGGWTYSDFRLLFDIPEGCSYLDGSLLVNGEATTPMIEDGRLSFSTSDLEDGKTVDVRFCVVPRNKGQYTLAALVGYSHYSWEDGTQQYASPIGKASFTAKPVEYNISTESFGSLLATGIGPQGATVSAFDGDVLLATTTVQGDKWTIDTPLPEAYNLSVHPVRIECKAKDGNAYTSPTEYVTVNIDQNTVSRVKMLYPNAWKGSTEECTWDFINPDTKVESYDFYPSSNSYTFLIDFVRNDTTDIQDVELTAELENGTSVNIPARFDEGRGCWVASTRISSFSPVEHVSVSFINRKSQMRIDAQHYADVSTELATLLAEHAQLVAIANAATADNIDQQVARYEQAVGYSLMREPTQEDAEWAAWASALTPEELRDEAQALIDDLQAQVADLDDLLQRATQPYPTSPIGTYTMDDGTIISITDCSAYSEATILAQGFQRQDMTDGTYVYCLNEDQRSVVVSFKEGYAIETRYTQPMNGPRRVSVFDICEQGRKFLTGVLLDNLTKAVEQANAQLFEFTASLFAKRDALMQAVTRLEQVLANPNAGLVSKTAARAALFGAKKALMHFDTVLKVVMKAVTIAKKIIPLAKYASLIYDFVKTFNEYKALWRKTEKPCENDQAGIAMCRDMIESGAKVTLAYVTTKLVAQVGGDIAMLLGIAGAPETGGGSLLVSAAAYLLKQAALFAADWAFEKNDKMQIAAINRAIDALQCEEEEEEPKPEDPGEIDRPRPPRWPHFPRTPRKRPLHDPSGFVCEAVESNRLEGVTATCLYKKEVEDMYGDKHEEIVVWDVENYGQVNPQLTDQQGMYGWMVPAGQWQVLYEKDGYETQHSAWLPVPPPQLDVNVGMVRRAQPTLSDGHAYERAIDLDFSLYMKTRYITDATVTFWQDGQQLSGEVTASNAETAFGQDKTDGEAYVRSLRFVPKKTLAVGSQVTVRVSGLLRSYADVAIGEDLERTLTVGREVTSIGSEGHILVPYGGSHQVVISALSPAAAAFKQVKISTLSPDIAGLETSQVTLDAEGKAYVTISGRLPGTTYLSYAVEGSQVSGMDTVRVVSDLDFVAAPKASLISGTYVGEGTQVALTADPGCTIWYTLDGSCPCDEQKRQRYAGPITISQNTTLRAMAQTADGRESEVVTFTWFISTAVASPASSRQPTGQAYDLQGRPVTAPAHGVIIQDGRKVMKKDK